MNVILIVVCVTCAGLAAGLTIGLSSVDKVNLKILQKTGTESEVLQATKIAKITEDNHYMLVSLLIFNSISNECLPIFLNRICSETFSVLISVTLVLFFGEIIPSAIFSGAYKL